MARYWVNFARNGNPNEAGLVAWPRFTGDGGQVLYLDDPVHQGAIADAKTLAVFDAVYAGVRGAAPGR
jgi:para-nitrobenzyl esterase